MYWPADQAYSSLIIHANRLNNEMDMRNPIDDTHPKFLLPLHFGKFVLKCSILQKRLRAAYWVLYLKATIIIPWMMTEVEDWIKKKTASFIKCEYLELFCAFSKTINNSL